MIIKYSLIFEMSMKREIPGRHKTELPLFLYGKQSKTTPVSTGVFFLVCFKKLLQLTNFLSHLSFNLQSVSPILKNGQPSSEFIRCCI
jgi:hypothetical protein